MLNFSENNIQKKYKRLINRQIGFNYLFGTGLVCAFLYNSSDGFKQTIPVRELLFIILFGTLIIVPLALLNQKLRKRLICSIIKNGSSVSFIIYDGKHVEINLSSPIERRHGGDWYINTLFSAGPLGIIHSSKIKDTFILIISNKKYYLVPGLFEKEEMPIW